MHQTSGEAVLNRERYPKKERFRERRIIIHLGVKERGGGGFSTEPQVSDIYIVEDFSISRFNHAHARIEKHRGKFFHRA